MQVYPAPKQKHLGMASQGDVIVHRAVIIPKPAFGNAKALKQGPDSELAF